jgi:CheY-like chemotaxis protein
MRNANVLVVEDDESIRRLLVDYLEQRSSVSVEGARDGVEALHLISTHRYAVVVLDVMMPKMSGVDLLDSVKAMLSDPSVRSLESPPAFVVITATSASTLPADKLQQRFPRIVRGVFRKPLDMPAFGNLIEQLLRETRSKAARLKG